MGNDRFIALVECVLQVHRPDHQTRIHAGTTQLLGIAFFNTRLELRPVNPLRQHVQWVVVVESFRKMGTKQFTLRNSFFRLHFFASFAKETEENLANFSALSNSMVPLFLENRGFVRDD